MLITEPNKIQRKPGYNECLSLLEIILFDLQTHLELQSKIQCNRNEKAISDPRAQLVYGVIYTDATMFGCSQQGQLLTCSPGSLGISNRIIISQNARKTYEYLFQVIGKITENTLNCKIFILPNVPE